MQIGSAQVFANQQNSESDKLKAMGSQNFKAMNDKKMKDVASEFESLFINMLFKNMRQTVPKDQWLDGGMKQEIFTDMLYNEYAKNFSKAGGIGLGDMVYKYLKQTAKTGGQ